MSISQARASGVTTPFTAIVTVTGVRGTGQTVRDWYVQDPSDGGPEAGVAVYCNRTMATNPCPSSIITPSQWDVVEITGSLVTFKGRLELHPTTQTIVMSGAQPPPLLNVGLAEVAASGSSQYRGVRVEVGMVTADDVTPPALYNAKCGADGGMPLCSGCVPPTYSGFQANDGFGDEAYIENFFYPTEHMENSPECLSATGTTLQVMVGTTFSTMIGILDLDTASGMQALYPVTDSDYSSP
jgi:hypothetical protein